MNLCLDVGNTHIYGGIFKEDTIVLRFRYPSHQQFTSDQLGVFFKSMLRENNISINEIENVAICSVVPSLDYSIRSAFLKYFDLEPFILQSGVKTGLNIRCKNPQEVGADRIANCIGAQSSFSGRNCIIVDFGTATTIDVLDKNGALLGGTIMPGLNIQMKALHQNTANLPPVRIFAPNKALGKTTLDSIQSGLFHGHTGAITGIIASLQAECFNGENALIIGTGGFSTLFQSADIFDVILPDLVLQGLKLALEKNAAIA
jgi:type III pantothenate kinase